MRFPASREDAPKAHPWRPRAVIHEAQALSERLTNLEVTVAQGFHDLSHDMTQGFEASKARDIELDRKIDASTESLRREIRTVIDTVNSLGEEIRRKREGD